MIRDDGYPEGFKDEVVPGSRKAFEAMSAIFKPERYRVYLTALEKATEAQVRQAMLNLKVKA